MSLRDSYQFHGLVRNDGELPVLGVLLREMLDELVGVQPVNLLEVVLVHHGGLWEALHLDGCGLEQRLRRQQWNG